jgi:hypothetical protein
MNLKNTACCSMSATARFALCVGLGAALSVSNGPAVGVAVAAGLWLALTLGARRA